MKKIALGVVAVAVAFSFSLAGAANYNFQTNLTLGSTGADVTALQSMLVAKGYLVMPAGTAYGYFGGLTQSAVAKLQMANGITPASGYFGPITRAKVNTMSADGGATGGSGTPSTPGSLGEGEASLESFDISAGDDDDVQEGASAEIAEIEFDVEDGDIQINRVDLQLVGSGDEQDPWDTFESVALLVDGKEVASKDIDDEDAFLDEDAGTVRITGVDAIFNDGDTAKIVVELTAQDSVDGTDDDEAWTVAVLDDGVRGTDGEGIEQYVGSDAESVAFDVVEEGDGEELNVSSSDEDPESETLKVEDDAKSDEYTIFAFDVESEEGDIEFNTVEIEIETADADANDMIDDLVLEIDGESFDDWEFVDLDEGATTTATVEFDIDGDFTLDADSGVTAVLKATFKAANGTNYATGTIQASIADEAIDAEGADDLLSDGTAVGEEHTLTAAGIVVLESGFTDEGSSENNDENTSRDFEFTFEVTAFEEDFYIATSSIAIFTEGAGTVATSSFTVDSTGDEDVDGVFTVEEGETETFTVVVTISDVTVSGQYRVGLDSVQSTENSNGISARTTKDVENSDFRTAYATVNN